MESLRVFKIMVFSALALSLGAAQADVVRTRGPHSINLRTRPNGPIVGVLHEGEELPTANARSRGGWISVIYNGQTVYVFNTMVRVASEKPTVGPPLSRDLGKVMVDSSEGANLRVLPSNKSQILENVPDDTEVTIVGSPRGDWVPVSWDGKIGYVHKDLLSGEALTAAYSGCPSGKCGTDIRAGSDIRETADSILTVAQNSDLQGKLSLAAWSSATRGRQAANFLGGGWRSGNRSKGMCAAGAKEAWVTAGICTSTPGGNAYELYSQGTIAAKCPGLKKSSIRDPKKAPPGSVIVYSGYAGHIPHHFGHVETKVLVTEALYKKIRGDSKVGNVKVGDTLYCSDFCRATPTMTAHNPVAAIYVLK